MSKYIYCLSYSDYDTSDYEYLIHDKRFSKKCFEDLIIKAAEKPLKKEAIYNCLSFSDIFVDVIEVLCDEYGFECLKVNVRVNIDNADLLNVFNDNRSGLEVRLSDRAIELHKLLNDW
jgi:hypothetical protein